MPNEVPIAKRPPTCDAAVVHLGRDALSARATPRPPARTRAASPRRRARRRDSAAVRGSRAPRPARRSRRPDRGRRRGCRASCAVSRFFQFADVGVDRRHRRDARDSRAPGRAGRARRRHPRQHLGERVHEHDVGAQLLVEADRALEERLREAELHEDERHREGDARDADERPEGLAAELQPGERDAAGHRPRA